MLWQLDDDAVARRITVISETEDIADRALKLWLEMHPTYRVVQTQLAASGATVLRNGSVMDHGVSLVCSYVCSVPR